MPVPLAIAHKQGQEWIESPAYTGEAVIVLLEVPMERVGDLNLNDANRRELAALIAAAIQAQKGGT